MFVLSQGMKVPETWWPDRGKSMSYNKIQELQQDAAAKEELVSVANKGMQRVTAKVEDLRSALRDESVEREELRSRVEQQAVQTREALDDIRSWSERREVCDSIGGPGPDCVM
eukprot:s669_g12.t1